MLVRPVAETPGSGSARQAWDSLPPTTSNGPGGSAPPISKRPTKPKKRLAQDNLKFQLTAPAAPHRHLESNLQQAMVDFFRRAVSKRDALLVAVPNGGPRKGVIGILVAEGMLAGWPDLMLLLRDGRTVWLEVKIDDGPGQEKTYLKPRQREVHTEIRALNHPVYVIRSLADLWAVVDHYGVPHRIRPAGLPRPAARPNEPLALLR